jgi:hypothetical protein
MNGVWHRTGTKPWSLRHVSERIIPVLARTMAGAKNVLAALDEGEGSVSRFCLMWAFVAGRHGANGVGAANGTENGPLDERKGKDVVGVEGKDAGSNDEED